MNKLMLIIALLIVPPNVLAQYYQNLTNTHPKAIGLANAVTADPPGLASVHYNPAGLHQITENADVYELHLAMPQTPEMIFQTQWTGEYPDNELNFLGCDVECILENPDDTEVNEYQVEEFYTNLPYFGRRPSSKVSPLGGISLRILDLKVTFATSTYMVFQGGYEIPDGEPGEFPRYGSATSDIVMLAPSFATSWGDDLYLGVSFPLHYFGYNFDSKIRLPNVVLGVANSLLEASCDLVDPIDICTEDEATLPLYSEIVRFQVQTRDNFTPSINIGLLWKIKPWLTFGAVYQGEVKHKATGEFVITYDDGINNILSTGIANILPGTPRSYDGTGRTEGKVTYKETLPAHYSFGFSVRVFPNLKINIDHKTTEFSKWQDQKFFLDQPTYLSAIMGLLNEGGKPNTVISGRSFEDGTNLAFGVEYQWNDHWLFRLGYENRDSVIAPENRSFSFPLGDTTVKGIGINYRVSKHQFIDFAYNHIYSEQYIASGSSIATTWNPSEINAAYPGYNIGNTIEINNFVISYTSDW